MQFNRKGLRSWRLHGIGLCVAAATLVGPGSVADAAAGGATYRVGPSRQYKTLNQVADRLRPGDVVEVDGDATYPGEVIFENDGAPGQKIVVRGVRVNGRRPVLSGGRSTVELSGDHYVFEGFEVKGGSTRCVFHHADDITIRDSLVHHCPGHGILGADSDSGSLTMDHVEVHSSGSGTTRHQVYMATDESAHPGSVFRMQHCYIHDGTGGNNVKTRAERNEIYYNWIEGAAYHALELIGPDGQNEARAREDSDVVGNVLFQTGTHFTVRAGGDGTGQTWGRYRFVNNTFLLAQGGSAAIHPFDGIESVELHNNLFHRRGGGAVQIIRDDGDWAGGSPILVGTKNAMPQGSTGLFGLTQTVWEDDPEFLDEGDDDFRLSASSPLRNACGSASPGPS
ncbi:MAG TPA: hypothetical protein VLS89_17890, partial [Candidatus Nanopelagicales bacterium]|nr:hypothetical protein [Candidatus Nanopelagicales bacterium]